MGGGGGSHTRGWAVRRPHPVLLSSCPEGGHFLSSTFLSPLLPTVTDEAGEGARGRSSAYWRCRHTFTQLEMGTVTISEIQQWQSLLFGDRVEPSEQACGG